MARKALSSRLVAASATPCGIILTALILFLNSATQAQAGDKEVREFAVTVDGKAAGANVMDITTEKDGRQIMSNRASIKVSYFVASYKYTYFGTEIWKDGLLQGFTSTCDDDGKKFSVKAEPGKSGLRVTVNKKERGIPSNVWLTTYWRLPDPKNVKDGKVTIMDADTAKELSAKLQKVKAAKVVLAGRECSQYRLTGDVKVDLWYDDQARLVRQEYDDDGHHVVLMLKNE